MTHQTRCPQCNEWMEVERVDNGVMMVWHGIHCGWGQAYFADEDVHTLDATTPAPMGSNIREEDIGKSMMRSKGGDGE